MPITREPSQRALNWVRWNSSKSSLSSLKSNSPTEIIHLGGSRVGTPTEPDPPAPDRSKAFDRPTTAWAFNGPAPEPPGIGVGIARSATPLAEISQTPTELYAPDNGERPITQWYMPEWEPPTSTQTENGPNDRNQGLLAVPTGLNPAPAPPRFTATRPPPVAPPTSFPSPVSSLPSAVSSTSTNSSSIISVAKRRSPITQPYTASTLSYSSTSEPASEASNRPSRETPSSPLVPPEENALSIHIDPFTGLRRTQSHADIHGRVQKALPPRPLGAGRDEEAHNREEYGRQHVGQLIRSNTSPSNHVGVPLRIFPPLANAPPKSPLPAISEKTNPRDRPGSRSRPPPPLSQRKERSPPRQAMRLSPPPPQPPPTLQQDQPPQQQQQLPHQQTQARPKPPKLTPRERLWLHRNYRGEATFLRAWGLHITSEEDREEGLTILRELIAGEAEDDAREEERQRQRQYPYQHARSVSASASASASAPSLPPPPPKDGAGLGVIVEERNSRELVRVPPTKERLGYSRAGGGGGGGGQEMWRKGGGGGASGVDGHQRLMLPIDAFNARRVDKHARSESDSSVLGAYLDIRMSRLDD